MKLVLCLVLVAVLLAACMSTYHNQFGGYPLESEEYTIKHESMLIKLLVTYRYPYQAAELDTSTLNITVKTIVAKQDLKQIHIDRLTLAATDSSYLYSYPNPAIYDTYGKYPLRTDFTDLKTGSAIPSSDQICIFTVNRFSTDYDIHLYYQVQNPGQEPESFEHVIPIIISKVKYEITLPDTTSYGP